VAVKQEWAERALAALESEGARSRAARRAVVQHLAGQRCCLSAREIADGLRADGERIGTATVYRALDRLHRIGLVQRIEVGTGGARYEPAMPGGEHHHHVICERCGTLTPFDDPGLERAIERLAGRLGHRVSGHDVLIRGECPRCVAAGR
jgi:Fur family ferric uptake transcriptional regulator